MCFRKLIGFIVLLVLHKLYSDNSTHPLETEVNPLKTACGCRRGGVRFRNGHTHHPSSYPTECICQCPVATLHRVTRFRWGPLHRTGTSQSVQPNTFLWVFVPHGIQQYVNNDLARSGSSASVKSSLVTKALKNWWQDFDLDTWCCRQIRRAGYIKTKRLFKLWIKSFKSKKERRKEKEREGGTKRTNCLGEHAISWQIQFHQNSALKGPLNCFYNHLWLSPRKPAIDCGYNSD